MTSANPEAKRNNGGSMIMQKQATAKHQIEGTPITMTVVLDPKQIEIENVQSVMRDELVQLGYGEQIDTTDFDTMGIDSLDCLQLVAALEDRYDIIISPADLVEITTFNELCQVVIKTRG